MVIPSYRIPLHFVNNSLFIEGYQSVIKTERIRKPGPIQ